MQSQGTTLTEIEGHSRTENCLEAAARLVHVERQGDYGHPEEDFTKVTSAANALGVNPLSGPLHHALYMILVKIARLVETPDHRDSIVDIPGYARTYEMILEKQAERGNERLYGNQRTDL